MGIRWLKKQKLSAAERLLFVIMYVVHSFIGLLAQDGWKTSAGNV